MESICFCGEALTGDDMDALVDSGLAHFTEVHPDLELIEVQIRNFLESEKRIDGPTDRLDEIGEIEVKPISSAVKQDIVEFFDRRAFADNPAWGMCYCVFHHIGGDTGAWEVQTWQDNRSHLASRIDAGTTTGVVAYVDGVLAGFCNATARTEFPDRDVDGQAGIGSIVCFVVAPPYRGHGVQKALVAGAVEELTRLGLDYAEAYPIREPDSVANAFVGTLKLFENEGFEIYAEEPRLTVRKALN